MRRRRNNDDDENGFGEWAGGYMGAKKSKLMEQYEKETTNELNNKLTDIFKGVAIFVNGYTIPSSEELKYIMALHGGIYHHYQSSGTTHIIASILPDTKIKQLGNNVKIVKPGWVSDSVEANKLLDYKPYLLYSNHSKTQPKLNLITTTVSPQKDQNSTHADQQQYHTRTANDPDFLNDFYNKSRLHLISTLGTMFKKKITDIREQSDFNFNTARQKFRDYVAKNPSTTDQMFDNTNFTKIVMHIDMDCFFVSVGLLTRPELRGKPVAVTHSRAKQDSDGGDSSKNSMSEIASCSYEARKMGVKNGMFLGTAYSICPNLQTISYNFNEYTRISNILYDTVTSYTLEVEAVSCDEMYVDITELLKDTTGSVEQWATYIRTEIRDQTKCPCSTGFGSNRLQARLATRSAKPDGQFILEPDNVELYMQAIKISDLPGVGYAHSNQLKEMNLSTCNDLQNISLAQLQTKFGNKTGKYLYDSCRGIDEKNLVFEHEQKSISAEVNYGIRFQTNKDAIKFFDQLSTEVHSRLTNIHKKGKCITLKLMVRAKDAPVETTKFLGHGVCENITKSSTLNNATDDLNIIKREILSIWKKLDIPPYELRGIGIHISRLEKHLTSALPIQLAKFLNNPPTATSIEVDKKVNNPPEKCLISGKIATKGGKKNIATNGISKYLQNETTKIEIDQEFLKNLPEDIRLEVINEYNLKDHLNVNKTHTNDNKIDEDFLNNLPDDIRLEVMREYNLKIPSPSSSTNLPQKSITTVVESPKNVEVSSFESMDWKEVKVLINDWVTLENVPKLLDIDMILKYACQMVDKRKIEILYEFVKYFYRLIIVNNKNCEWHRAYRTIIDGMQKSMLKQYKAKLASCKPIQCKHCCK